MKNRLIIASALAAAFAAPAHRVGPGRSRTRADLQGGKVLRHREGRQERLRLDGQQLVCRDVEGERRSARLDLRARGLLRADRQRKHDAEGVKMRSAVVTRPVAGQRAERAGIGLRLPHLAEVAAGAISPSWLEVHPENFLANPHAHELLLQIAQRCAISAHTVGLSIGSAEGVDREHLARIRRFVDQLDPILVSGHLAWSTHRGTYLNDLLPFPYDDETLRIVAATCARCRTRSAVRMWWRIPRATSDSAPQR